MWANSSPVRCTGSAPLMGCRWFFLLKTSREEIESGFPEHSIVWHRANVTFKADLLDLYQRSGACSDKNCDSTFYIYLLIYCLFCLSTTSPLAPSIFGLSSNRTLRVLLSFAIYIAMDEWLLLPEDKLSWQTLIFMKMLEWFMFGHSDMNLNQFGVRLIYRQIFYFQPSMQQFSIISLEKKPFRKYWKCYRYSWKEDPEVDGPKWSRKMDETGLPNIALACSLDLISMLNFKPYFLFTSIYFV